MEIFERTINVKNLKTPIYMDFIGDVHLGSKNCAVQKFLDALERGKKKNAYVVGMGDYTDCIPPRDRRYEKDESSEDKFMYQGQEWNLGSIDGQHQFLERALEPIAAKGRLIGLVLGNHGAWVYKETTANLLRMMCGRLNTQYMSYFSTWSLIIKHKGKEINRIKFVNWHGYGGGTGLGSVLTLHEKLRAGHTADVYVFGHFHQLLTFKKVRLDADTRNRKSVGAYSWHAVSGSFLRTYRPGVSGYGEIPAYNPLPVGFIRATIVPNKGVVAMDCIDMDVEE